MSKDITGAYILAAGRGRRMGEIGEALPKALWPVFEKNFLEIVYDFTKTITEKVYLNAEENFEHLERFIKRKRLGITILEEEELLGVGGAIYNLKEKTNLSGHVMVHNCDIFLALTPEQITEALTKYQDAEVILFAKKVSAKSGLNRLVLEKDHLQEIAPYDPKHSEDYWAYTGCSLINFDTLDSRSGRQSFFSTVADYQNKKVAVVDIGETPYFDLGTFHNYYSSIFTALDENSPIRQYLSENGAFMPENYHKEIFSYNTEEENKVIMRMNRHQMVLSKKGIYYKSYFTGI